MAQAAGRIGVPVRFTGATTITEITGVPPEAAYIRIRGIGTDVRLVLGSFTDGAAIGGAYETYEADVNHYRAVDQNLEQDDQIGIAAASGTPTIEVTFLRQGK